MKKTMIRIASVILAITILCSCFIVCVSADDEVVIPEWLEDSDYTEEEKEYIVSHIGAGWLEHFAFDEEGTAKAIQHRADYFETTFEEMKAYLEEEAEKCDATIGYEIEDGSVAVISNKTIRVNLAPGFSGLYDVLDPEEVFPGIEIENIAYLDTVVGLDGAYPRDYKPELYARSVVLTLKNGGIDALNDAIEKLYALDYVMDAYMGRIILGIKSDIVGIGEEKLNARDVTALMKYLVGWDVTIDVEKADFNSDGKLNSKDVMAMMKALVQA